MYSVAFCSSVLILPATFSAHGYRHKHGQSRTITAFLDRTRNFDLQRLSRFSHSTPRRNLDQPGIPPVASAHGRGAEGHALLDAQNEPLLHVVFVSPQIHWNTGNIGRTCLGLGARLHLVGPLGFSLDEKQVRRAGLDYWQHVDLRVYANWEEFAQEGGAMERIGGTRYFFTKFGAEGAIDVDWSAETAPITLIFGSEIDGFECIKSWMESRGKVERKVAFPMVDSRFRSFNLSTSASMALWDVYKSLTLVQARAIV